MLALVMMLCCCFKSDITDITNVDLFINGNYIDSSVFKYPGGTWEAIVRNDSTLFFPKYDSIEHSYSNIEFYIYSYGVTGTYVLDLTFADEEEYKKAKEDVFPKYEFLEGSVEKHGWTVMPKNEIQVGNYACKIVNECEYVDYPHQIAAICTSEKEFKIRYFYYYDQDLDSIISDSSLIDVVTKYSSCKW